MSGFLIVLSRSQTDFVAQCFQTMNEIALEAFGTVAIKIVSAEVLIVLVVLENVVDDD